MLTEKEIHSTRIDEHGSIFWLKTTVIEKNGKEIARTNHSTTLYPTSDLAGVPEQVAAIARATWNPEKVAAFSAQFIAIQNVERDKQAAAIAEVDAITAALSEAQAALDAQLAKLAASREQLATKQIEAAKAEG